MSLITELGNMEKILDLTENRELTPLEISRSLGISISTAYRRMRILKEIGWVKKGTPRYLTKSVREKPHATYIATIKLTRIREVD